MERKKMKLPIIIIVLLIICTVIGVFKYRKSILDMKTNEVKRALEATRIKESTRTIDGRIDIGGYSKLYVNCYGKGAPTVIFESGLGCLHSDWKVVQNEISKNTRTFSYDRAGRGNSDPGDLPRSSLAQVHELHTVLNKAKVIGPYIIVAHSIGGYNARLFAGTYPKEVSGIIFVDCSHENQYENMIKRSSSKEIEIAKSEYVGGELTFDQLLISANQVKEIRKRDALRNIPIVVLTSGNKSEIWLNYQNDLLSLSDNSKHIVVADSGHYIQKDKPQVVINAIREMLNGMSK